MSELRLIALVLSCGMAASVCVAQTVTTPADEKASIPAARPGEATGEAIGEFVVRFYAGEDERKGALPSMILVGAFPAIGPVPEGFSIAPKFSSEGDGQGVVVAADAGTSFYGTGLVGSGGLERVGTSLTSGVTEDGHAFPWVLGVRPNGSAFGLLADTTYPCTVDIEGERVRFSASGPAFPLIAIERPTPHQVLIALGELTGRMDMPARWALGFQYGRRWKDAAEVLDVARAFREKQLSCDAILFGQGYTNGGRAFSFDPKAFADPRELNKRLNYWGFNTIWELPPAVAKERNYFVYDAGTSGGHWVKTPGGEPAMAAGVEGEKVLPDFTDREARLWWATQIKTYFKTNKMQGISVPAAGSMIPSDAVFSPSDELAGRTGNPGDAVRFRERYSELAAEAAREGLLASEPGNRPFVVSQPGSLGGQRAAASTIGSLPANWEGLRQVLPRVLNLGLSGQPFVGTNIGGDPGAGAGAGPSAEDGRLYARWMGLGTMLPLAFSDSGQVEREPWSFGREVEETCRMALQRRYRLVPFLYTLFRESSLNNLPLARPVFMADPADASLRGEDRAFVLGNDVLVVPKLVPGEERSVAMPKGWRKFDFPVHERPGDVAAAGPAPTPDRSIAPPPSEKDSMAPYRTKDWPRDGANEDLPDLYIRPGAIVPTGPVSGHTNAPVNPVTFIVCLDAQGRAEGRMYSDPNEGFTYRDMNYFRAVLWQAVREGDQVTVSVAKAEGVVPNPQRMVIVRVLLPDGSEAVADGNERDPVVVDLVKDKQ